MSQSHVCAWTYNAVPQQRKLVLANHNICVADLEKVKTMLVKGYRLDGHRLEGDEEDILISEFVDALKGSSREENFWKIRWEEDIITLGRD